MEAYDYGTSPAFGDARQLNADGGPGSGIGFAPVGSDGREDADGLEPSPSGDLSQHKGTAIGWTDERDEIAFGAAGLRTSEGHGSGSASLGSPAREYPRRITGYERVDEAPEDGGIMDTIRESDFPVRQAVSRFQFISAPWYSDIRGEFAQDRELIGEEYRGAAMPTGRMDPMDEYRMAGDGTHA